MTRAFSALLLLLAGLSVSCGSDPQGPGDTGPPAAGDLAAWSYPDGRHVTGQLSFLVTTEDYPGLSRVEAYVDDDFMGFREGLPQLTITFDVRSYPEGEHTVTLLVQTRDAKGELRYRGSLIFDHTPPSAGRLAGLEVRDGLPVIRWLVNEDPNFDTYRVRREAVGTLPEATFQIHDRATTEFVDTTLPEGTAGLRLEYSIAIHNGYEVGPRAAGTVQIGDLLDLSPYPGVEPVMSPLDPRTYMVDAGPPDRIVAFSAATNAVIDELPLPSASKALACSPDALSLVYADLTTLKVLDAQTLSTLHSIPFTGAVDAAFASDGRIFVARGGSAAAIEVFDAALDPVETIDVGKSPPSWVAVSPDAQRLYVINANPRTNPLGSLLSLDVSSAPAHVLDTYDLTEAFVQALLGPDGTRIYLAHVRHVEVLKKDGLGVVDGYGTPGDVTGIAVDSASLYVAFGVPPGTDESPRIERLDRQTLARLHTWRLIGPARNLVVTRDDARLYAYVTSPLAQMIGLDVP